MMCSIMATASIVSTLWGMKTRSWGMIVYAILSCCFCWIWLWNWLVFELSVCDGLKLLCFRYLWTHVVITIWTPMYEVIVNYLWNGCNMWLVMWITTILVVCKLVWNPSWFQLTTGFIWARVREFDRFGDCFCTCALINWSVLWQLASELDSTLNMSYGYLKTKAFVVKTVFQLIVIYKCSKIKKIYSVLVITSLVAHLRTSRWLI